MKKIDVKKIIKFICVILLFYFNSLFQLIPILLFNINLDTITPNEEMLLTIFSSLITSIILLIIYRNDFKKYWKDFKKNKLKIIDSGFKYWVLGLIFMAGSNLIINAFITNGIANNEEVVRGTISASPFLAFFVTSIFAPFIEEVTFRKAFKDVLHNKWLFVLTSGIVFGALHVITSFEHLYELLYIIPYSSLGIAFAYMYEKTNNMFTNILYHAFHNSILVIFLILSGGML